jgi:hypothetical protein
MLSGAAISIDRLGISMRICALAAAFVLAVAPEHGGRQFSDVVCRSSRPK